jgi:hypothetical protein
MIRPDEVDGYDEATHGALVAFRGALSTALATPGGVEVQDLTGTAALAPSAVRTR